MQPLLVSTRRLLALLLNDKAGLAFLVDNMRHANLLVTALDPSPTTSTGLEDSPLSRCASPLLLGSSSLSFIYFLFFYYLLFFSFFFVGGGELTCKTYIGMHGWFMRWCVWQVAVIHNMFSG